MKKVLKNIGIGFFLLIFAVGFFSQSIINYFIPKVYLEDIINNERLEKSIYLSGTLEPKEMISINLGRPVVIEEFYFVPGSYIKEGLALFKIDDAYGIEDIKALTQPLEQTIESNENEMRLILEKIELTTSQINDAFNEKEDAKDALNKYKKLYEAGAMSESDYASKEQSLSLALKSYDQLRVESNQLNNQKMALENEILNAQSDLNKLRKEAYFLENVDEEGIYYSEYNGVILDQTFANQLLDSNAQIMEIAKVNSYDDVYLKMQVDDDTMKYMNLNKSFYIEEAGREDPDRIQIVYKSYKTDNNLVEVRGEYKERDGIPFLGRAIEARIYIRSMEYSYIVPKSAIRTSGDSYDSESQSYIFTVMEENTVLGQEQVAHAVEVSILYEGDNYVAVQSLSDRLYRMKIIANLTYEIEDNARVLIVEEEQS